MKEEGLRGADQGIADSPYSELGGLELLTAMHMDGQESLSRANSLQIKYVRAVCRRAGVDYPAGLFDVSPEEVWRRRLVALGYPT